MGLRHMKKNSRQETYFEQSRTSRDLSSSHQIPVHVSISSSSKYIFRQISLFVVLSALLKQNFFSIYVFKSSKMWGTYRRCQFYLFTDIKDSLFVLFLLLEKSYHVQRKLSIWQQTGFSFCVNSIHNQFVQPELKNTT